MSVIKLARLSPEKLYERATLSALKNNPAGSESNWKVVNEKASKIKNRYNKYADYIKNKNIKRGLIGAGIVGGLIGGGYLYKKRKDK